MRKFKNLICILMTIATILSSVVVHDVRAADHNVQITDSTTWKLIGDYVGAAVTITVDGVPAFCMDSRILIQTGNNAEVPISSILPSSVNVDAVMNKLSLIAWYGYRSNPNETNYMLTQNLIWKYLDEVRGIDPQKNPTKYKNNYTYCNQYPTLDSMQTWFNNVMTKVNNFNKKPSFNGKTFTMKAGQKLTVTDTNGVLSELTIRNNSKLNISKNGNTLIIEPTLDATGTIDVVFDRGMTSAQTQTNFVVRSGGNQPVSVCYSGKDPYLASLRVNVVTDLQLAKKDPDGYLVPGTTFKVSRNADMSNPLGTYTTGNNGKVIVPNLTVGETVYIQEIAVPAYLQVDSKIVSKTLTYSGLGLNYYTATNKYSATPPLNYLQIAKMDEATREAVPNATFKVSYNADMSNPLGTYTTNNEGYVVVPGVWEYHKIYVQEISVPPEYQLDSTIHEVKLYAEVAEGDNLVKKGGFKLYYFTKFNKKSTKTTLQLAKKDPDGNLIPGTSFKVSYNADMSKPIGTYTTGPDGKIVIEEGIYEWKTIYIQEVAVPPGLALDETIYKKDLWAFDLNGEKMSGIPIYYYTATNQFAEKTTLQLAKKDPDGNLIPGTSFKVSYNADMSNPLGTYTTGPDGKIVIEEGIYEWTKIYIQEVAVPPGLALDETIYSKNMWALDLNGDRIKGIPIYYYTATNQFAEKTTLQLAKKDPTGDLVPGTTFKVSYNADMSNPLGTYTTGPDGTVVIEEGIYEWTKIYIQEVAVPQHLKLDDTIYSKNMWALDLNGDRIKGIPIYYYTAVNDWADETSLYLIKKDPDGNPVPGTTFKVSFNADMSNPLGTYTTKSDGGASVTTPLPEGATVYIQEISVPEHLKLDDTIYKKELIEYDENGNQIEGILVHYYSAVNDWNETSLEITKKDDKGNYVSDVLFKVSYSDDMKNLVGTVRTDENGKATVGGIILKYDKVYVQEVSVPEHLELDDKIYEVSVSAGKTAEYEAVNRTKLFDITVSKTVSGNASDSTKDFGFRIVLNDASIEGTYGDVTFVKGAAEFTLSHGESATARGIPMGISYTVEENEYSEYITRIRTSDNSKWKESLSTEGVLNSSKTIEFENGKEISPETGIDLNVSPFTLITFISLVGIVLLIIIRHKKV